jgi:hypothetical protein
VGIGNVVRLSLSKILRRKMERWGLDMAELMSSGVMY